MRPRLLAAGGLLLALVLHLAVTRPQRQELAGALEESRRLRGDARGARAHLAELERGESLRVRAFADAAAAGAAPLAALRGSALAALQRSQVGGVRLEVRPGTPPLAATLKLSAAGPQAEVLALVERLSGPGTGIVLQQVRLAPAAGGLSIDMEAARLGGAP